MKSPSFCESYLLIIKQNLENNFYLMFDLLNTMFDFFHV